MIHHNRLKALTILAFFSLSMAGISASGAQDNRSSEDIYKALKQKPKLGKTRGFNADKPEGNPRTRQFIKGLTGRKTRQITVEERKELSEIIEKEELPSIDLTIYFEFDSTQVTIRSEPTLIKLGQALSHKDLAGATILIAGHTDAKGDDYYNLDLSKRRAEAIRDFLNRSFGLNADKLVTVGFGEEKLKPELDPYSPDNRRVQITNLTQ